MIGATFKNEKVTVAEHKLAAGIFGWAKQGKYESFAYSVFCA